MIEHSEGRISGMLARMDAMEENQKRLERMLLSSVDDIKNMLKAEIADLKSEQITDLRRDQRTLEQRLDAQNVYISDIRTRQESWDFGAGIFGWVIKVLIAVAGIIAGYFGAKHL